MRLSRVGNAKYSDSIQALPWVFPEALSHPNRGLDEEACIVNASLRNPLPSLEGIDTLKYQMSKYRLGEPMPRSTTVLTDEDRTLLLKVSNLLEEVIETLNILEDEDTMKSIKEAEEDIKAGRVRNYNDFTKELKQSGEI